METDLDKDQIEAIIRAHFEAKGFTVHRVYAGGDWDHNAFATIEHDKPKPCHCYDHCEDDDAGEPRRPSCRKRD